MIADVIIFGAIWAAIYTLIALGFSMIFGVARVLNLAHGAFVTIACYVVYDATSKGLGLSSAALISIMVTVLISLASYRFLIRPIRNSLARVLLSTLGLAMVIEQAVIIIFGPDIKQVPSAIDGGIFIWGVRITSQQLLAVAVSIVLIVGLAVFLNKTRLGRTIRAVALDREMSSLMGVKVEQTFFLVMAISATLAAVAGVVVAPFLAVTPSMGWSPILAAFTIVVLGGMGNLWGTIIGALIVAYSEMVTSYIFDPQLKEAVTFTIMVLALIFRPHGILGKGVSG